MFEIGQPRKNKINLSDYPFQQDINNRLVMAEFSTQDLEVLEEILYSSIKIPIKKLAKSTDLDEEEMAPTLEKLSKTGLFVFEDETIVVDKEMRKYFEAQIVKFDPDFKPGMEFLQHLLRKVPIHILPTWYAIPRSSNNIFDSLVERYLLTPQIFQRYLLELNFADPLLSEIVKDVYAAPECEVFAKDLIRKYRISREKFEESLLFLEFSLVCFLGYKKVDDHWQEVVTPFYEWKEYLDFLRTTETKPIVSTGKIRRFRPADFSFITDLTTILSLAKKQPLPLEISPNGQCGFAKASLAAFLQKTEGLTEKDPHLCEYIHRLIHKLRMLKLADVVGDRLYALEGANDWMDMRVENRAIFMYRHPLNRLLSETLPGHLLSERNIREAEKSILRVLDAGWVTFDDFIHGVTVHFGEASAMVLKRLGKAWHYTPPSYTEAERALIKSTLFSWLFELGITAIGEHEGRDCFCVTAFGRSFFAK